MGINELKPFNHNDIIYIYIMQGDASCIANIPLSDTPATASFGALEGAEVRSPKSSAPSIKGFTI
jgi:hypothetical protein